MIYLCVNIVCYDGCGEFDTTGAEEAIGLCMAVALAFAALRNGSFRSGWFESDFGIKKGCYELDIFVVYIWFEVNKE
jgi:hypothetical protein